MELRNSGIILHNSSSRQNNSNRDLVDRISGLHDSILGVILSFLPTENAVATSILSKRWKFVWRTVHNLDFCHEFEEQFEYDNSDSECEEFSFKEKVEGEDLKFVQFVNHVFRLRDRDGGFLIKFRLVWNRSCISPHASSWINTAITKNVHELFVISQAVAPFEVPASVFKCDSLQSLELNCQWLPVYVSDDFVFCLPRLKSLKLILVYFCSEEDLEKLISGCPVLNYLHLSIDSLGNEGSCIISSTSLRRLELCFAHRIKLKLQASSLEYLKLEGNIWEIFVHKSLTSLVEAEFRSSLYERHFSNVDICNSIIEAVSAFDCAKALTFSADIMWALSFATISLSTEFNRLARLNTELYCCYCSSLQEFIQSSHNLEVLTVKKISKRLNTSDLHDHSHWIDPVEVPRCLSNSLKKVVLDGYYGYDDEREMIRYILMHGSVLEAMMISLDSQRDNEKFELLQEICEFSRKSPACKVNFFG